MAKGSEARGEGQTRGLAVDGPSLEGRHISTLEIPAALLDPSLSTTVTGSFIDLSGNPVTSGQVRFELKPSIATVIQNQNVVEPSVIIGSINSSGQLQNLAGTGPCVVVRNTVLEPGGTYYEVSIWPEFIKTAVFNWFATQANQDISATIPLPPVLPFVPTNLSGLIRIFMMTASGSYAPSSGTRVLYVECAGGQGGGGSCSSTSSNATASGGGAGGAYAASFVTPILASYAVTIGAAGVAGAVGQNPGGAGGDTIFGANVVVAKGGGGGSAGTVAGTAAAVSSGGVCPGGSVGDVVLVGGPGSAGAVISSSIVTCGSGGITPVLGSGPGVALNWPVSGGAQATGRGPGAGTAYSGTYSATAGINGQAGQCRIWEFA